MFYGAPFPSVLGLPTRLDDLYSFLHDNDNENLNLIFSVDQHINPKKHVIQQLVACMRSSTNSEIRRVGRSASLIPNPSTELLQLEHNGSLEVANSLVSRSVLASIGLRHRVTRFLGAEYDEEKGKLVSSAPAGRLRRNHAYLDLMIWAIMFDQSHDVVEYFWQHGGNSTSNALFAAILLRAMASTKALMKEQFKRAREEMNASSEEFEKWACGVLEECHNDDSVLTQLILKTQLFHLRGFTSTDAATNCTALALFGQRTKFLSHSALLAKVDIDWYGDIDPQTSMGFIVANAICPPLLLQGTIFPIRFIIEGPKLNKGRKKSRARRKADLGSKSGVSLRGRKVGPAPADKPSLLDLTGAGDAGTLARVKLGKIAKFYDAPVVKFLFGVISHGMLLLLYSISILGDFTQPLSWLEYVLMFWFLAFTTAELNDVLDDGLRAWSSHYWNLMEVAGIIGFWTGMALRWWGREDRSYDDADRDMLEAAKLMFALGICCNFIMIFRFYAGIPSLGPKLIMMAKMGPDVGVYLALFVVFMLLSGVFTETVLGQHRTGLDKNEVYNDEDFHLGIDTLRRVTYRPWFQQFGELFLDAINDDADCTGTESFQDCSGYHSLLPISAAFYFLVVNVVLVNLLIAMMARTYEIVQENSMEIWHLQMHEVLREYGGRSAVPVPLSLPHTLYRSIVHIGSILYHLLARACGGASASKSKDDATATERMELDAVNSRMVESFQEKHTDRYLDKKDREEQESRSVENSIRDLKEGQHHSMVTLNAKMVRLEATMDRIVTEQAKEIQRSLASMNSVQSAMQQDMAVQLSRFDSFGNKKQGRMDEVEAEDMAALHPGKNLEHSLVELQTEAMSWDKARKEALLLLPKKYELAPDRSMGIWKSTEYDFKWFKPEGTNHQIGYCYRDPTKQGLALHDPSNLLVIYKCEEVLTSINTLTDLEEPRMVDGSLVKRQMIIPSARPWTRAFPEYAPLDYTAPHVHYFSKGSPVDAFKWGHSARPEIVRRHGDRSKCRQDEDGRPLNPAGRTGVRGRGVLGKWGVNVAVHWIIIKPLIDKDDMAMERSGVRMSAVLLERHVDGDWTIPGRVQEDDAIDATLCTAFGLDGRTLQDSEELQTTEQILLDSPPNPTLSEAAGCDERDTDNAWVRFKIRQVDLGGSATVRNAGMKDGGLGRFEISDDLRSQSRLEWVVMHRHIHMQHASHYRIIEQLAKSQNTYW